MLSMLRFMADTGDARAVTLLWAVRTEADILHRQEFEGLEERLPGLSIHHILSEQPDYSGRTGLLDEMALRELLANCSREAHVFLCGPPPMMDAVSRALRRIGFRRGHIHSERFAL